MKAVILKGIPASGKTTYVMDNLQGYIHINKDKLREEYPHLSEKEISRKQKELIQAAAKKGLYVVVDNTHINPQSLSKVVEVCRKAGYEDIKIIDMFDKLVKEVGLKEAFATCLERNNAREKRVPVSVLYSMAYQDWYDVAELAWYPVMIVDLDWTLLNSDERHQVCRKEDGKLDYSKYFTDEMLSLDKPVKQLVDIINNLKHIYKVVIVSGRSNICEDKTLGMLPVDYDAVFMRNHFDHRDDSVVKKEILDLIEPFISTENTIVFDDRKRVIDMWRKNWLYVFNCSQKENNDF
mgnify:CR=1 FL=1